MDECIAHVSVQSHRVCRSNLKNLIRYLSAELFHNTTTRMSYNPNLFLKNLENTFESIDNTDKHFFI